MTKTEPNNRDASAAGETMAASLKLLKSRFRELTGVFSCQRSLMIGLSCVPVFAAIHFVAYWLRFEQITERRWLQVASTLSAVIVIKSFLFVYYKVYQGWGRHATFHDLVSLRKPQR